MNWWNNLSAKAKIWIGVGAFVLLGALANSGDRPNRNYSADRYGTDNRYINAAEQAGYKGKEAEEVARAAKQLCDATEGNDC